MKIFLIILSILILVGLGAILFMVLSMPKKGAYQHLTTPRIVDKPNVLALTAAFDGDPTVALQSAFSDLFKAYFKVKGAPKGPSQAPPMARYENFDDKLQNAETMTEEELKAIPWKGFTAIPVPEGSVMPEKAPPSVKMETVTYGTVAEIVHFGPYEEERPVIKALKDYIEDQGYVINGLHEEEYIIGPGVPFSKPEKYITIIRYQVRKR